MFLSFLLSATALIANAQIVQFVTTSKAVYNGHEVVRPTLTNPLKDSIWYCPSSRWEIRNELGNLVYAPPACSDFWAEMLTGESDSWKWDQRDNSGVFVGPGRYRVYVYFQVPGGYTAPVYNFADFTIR